MAKTTDRTAATARAHKAALERFERQVDPEGTLNPRERAIRAEHAGKIYFTRLALRSAQARRRRGACTSTPDEASATARGSGPPDSARSKTEEVRAA